MKYYWTRFRLSYPTVLVYMLQNSEYRIGDYLQWLSRVDDLRKVIKRRQLDYTAKARLLLAVIWSILVILYTFIIILIIQSVVVSDTLVAILAVILFVVSPLIIAYGIAILCG